MPRQPGALLSARLNSPPTIEALFGDLKAIQRHYRHLALSYPLSLLFGLSQWKISAREQHVLWWAGLRGALALALVLALPSNLPQRDSIVIATFAVVTFSVMIQGLTMKPLLRWLRFLPHENP